jgi:hypothetical protein
MVHAWVVLEHVSVCHGSCVTHRCPSYNLLADPTSEFFYCGVRFGIKQGFVLIAGLPFGDTSLAVDKIDCLWSAAA